ncbi:MAG TPA: 2-hydroxychromene-2-carboxylate isomerase [Burkholderiales bacterium]|jgi:2-hydroxychromene-2-carboxylate isomerase|nr:2-hydroxychromene-2-carboxylate isomerase [Burkholderiales bacterium]
MRRAVWYFDVISPFSYLHLKQFDRLPGDLDIEYVPVLFAGLLKVHGQKGPAEIPAKRVQTYRACVFMAQEAGIPFRFPPAHPFNPLHALRLLCGAGVNPANVHAVFDCIWRDGLGVNAPGNFAALATRLGVADPQALIARSEVKQQLIANTERAVARGIYGVPTFDFGGELFWGSDSIALMNAFAANPGLFGAGELARVSSLPAAAVRKEAG